MIQAIYTLFWSWIDPHDPHNKYHEKNTTNFYNGIILRLVPKRLISRWLETLKAQLIFFWNIRIILKKNHKAVRFWSIIEIFISLLHKQTILSYEVFFLKNEVHFSFKKWVPSTGSSHIWRGFLSKPILEVHVGPNKSPRPQRSTCRQLLGRRHGLLRRTRCKL